jgi:eukaryotic-like serine/threonine-protein kinase
MENFNTKRFGRYEILGELGRGAMGVVYKARDPQIDRMVAVKTIALRGQDEDAEKEFRMRFQNEAQAAGRLHHPGIVAVFDVGEDSETHDPYIVLEYVNGEALNRILARERKLPPDRALQLTQELAEALDYAHAQGVTHRDIKPGNILVTEDGRPKIADFGIAKLNLANLTIPGKLLGTPAYMAPEQLSGTAADGRSDLFSLGVILYAMVTGHSPFQGDSATTVCFKVANREPVPPSALDLNLPRGLDPVIARAMAKDPKRRFQRGSELAAAIAQLRNAPGPGTRTRMLGLNAEPTLSRGAAARMGYGAGLLRRAVQKAPIRDLILAAATIVLLGIIGAQTKLLVFTRQQASATAPAMPTHADPNAGLIAAGTAPAGAIAPMPPPETAVASPAPAAPAAKTSAAAKTSRTIKASTAHASKEAIVPLSTIELTVRHQFKDATLTVWVDGKLTLTRQLHGGTQKHLVVFNGVRGSESETFQIPAGRHTLKLRAQTVDQTVDLSKTIFADAVGGGDKTLAVSFDKHNTEMLLQWQ